MIKCLAKTTLLFFSFLVCMTILMWSLNYCGFDKQQWLNTAKIPTKKIQLKTVSNENTLQANNYLLNDTLKNLKKVATIILEFNTKTLSYEAQSRLEDELKKQQVNHDSQIVVYAGHTNAEGKYFRPHVTRLQAQTVARVASAYTRQIKIKLYEHPAEANIVLLEIL